MRDEAESGGSKAGIFLEEEVHKRCLYLEIELDIGDKRKRITWKFGGVLNETLSSL